MKPIFRYFVRRAGTRASDRRMDPLRLAAIIVSTAAAVSAQAATGLADQPIFATTSVPGNLALVLSVEYPTAVSVAYLSRNYVPATEYLGHFDPNKCYTYQSNPSVSTENFFYPSAFAANHVCSGQWSGNFLNWATMQTIDPFRWVLTGGYRAIDETSRTVIEKAWGTGQGGTLNFPDSTVSGSAIAGATPFPAGTTTLAMRVQGLGNKMRFTVPDTSSGISFTGNYYNNQNLSGSPVLTRTDRSINFNWDNSQADPLVNQSNMSAKWTARITAPATGSYTFRMRADDTQRLLINGVEQFNQTAYDGLQNHYSQTYGNVSAGTSFDIQVEFSQGYGGSSVVLEWITPTNSTYTPVGGDLASLYGSSAAYDGTSTAGGIAYDAYVRTKVCDASLGAAYLETNCVQYGSNYKPEGLLQKNANKIRYSALGYLNDSNIFRDGGVLRAQQKFIGPTQPVPGSSAIANSAREWDASNGKFLQNPDTTDASNTSATFGTISNSGVLNYLNKFGEILPGSYKIYDNVSELYYAALRYFRALGDVPEWTAGGSASMADGFPVITGARDPILYSCQKNFILGIGDVNTHADKNLPGRLATQTNLEPALPSTVSADTAVDAVAQTDLIGAKEGLGNIGDGGNYNSDSNSAGIAGLAYWAHVNDIRPDDSTKSNTTGKQTVDTFWVDVQEFQTYANNNQFYLATKYGGFSVPAAYDPTSTAALTESWWHTNTDTLGGNKRPDNYFSGSQPNLVKTGLEAAFAKITSTLSAATTTSFSVPLPQVTTLSNSSFSSTYNPSNWTGEVTGSSITFTDANGNALSTPALATQWTFSAKLAAQVAGTGWDTSRRVVTWNGSAGVAFRTTTLATSDLNALDTTYTSGNDSTNFLNYLRGDQTNEAASVITSSSKAYRSRTSLLGDIVGSKAEPVGPPSFPYSDAYNPGYSAFKTTWVNRRTVVYVGANDGMMHAINGALVTTASGSLEQDADAGKEMFAYVPRALFQGPNATPNVDGLASLGNPSFAHHYMVNATPNVYDVDFGRTVGGIGTDWRSVLIGGLGKGGKAYYAIDVTDPQGMVSGGETTVAGKVLWEFSNSTTGMSGELGYTFGAPVVAKTRKYGWVVIFASGYNNADGKGYLFFVNPRTGDLLDKVSTGVGSPSSDAGFAQINAFIVDSSDGTADAIYGGDLLGNLWRVDVTATSGTTYASTSTANPRKLATLVDPNGVAQPVTSRPSIEVHPSTAKRFVMVGTGRLLDTTDIASSQVQTFYAITDGTNATFNTTLSSPFSFPVTRSQLLANTDANSLLSASDPTHVTFNPGTQLGWYQDLATVSGIGYRVTTDATTLSGSVSFAATVPNGDVCQPSGSSRVYARNYATLSSTLTNTTTVNNVSTTTLLGYYSLAGNVTDLRYLSVAGKASLIGGTDAGAVAKLDITPAITLNLRRLNWRELPIVD